MYLIGEPQGRHTLTNPTIQGTVSDGTGLTLPAFTGGGDISLGANKLKFTQQLIKDATGGYLGLRNLADTDYYSLKLNSGVFYSNIVFAVTAKFLSAPDEDNAYVLLDARDTGVGLVEIARLQGAADPYFQATLAMRLKPIATASLPATPVEGMIAYDDTANKLKVYNGTAWEVVTSA